jgi:uncharacterized Ntn-hydrolase superfamily protein
MTPIATYSIVACDLAAREWGVGVQSKFLAVGSAVPYAAAEVGAIATQAWANLRYGSDGLALLRGGATAQQTVDQLVANDEGRDDRQVGIVDREGNAATFTGSRCFDWAGGRTGAGYAAQGNILVGAATVDAIAVTFERSGEHPLAERLIRCLEAAQAAGGDRRGQQSASLLVVREGAGYGGGSDVAVDLRVDEHATPLAELRRIFGVHQLLFGQTPAEEWVRVDDELRTRMRDRLNALGYTSPDVSAAFEEWVGTENLEERVDGMERIDPVVLRELLGA